MTRGLTFFTLRVIAYVMLTGINPFIDPAGIKKTRDLICDVDFAPSIPASVTPMLSRAIRKLLAKEVRNRYGSAREVLVELYEAEATPEAEETTLNAITEGGATTFVTASVSPREARPENGRSADELANLAYVLNSNRDYGEAEKYSTKALEMNPRHVPSYMTREGFRALEIWEV